MKKIQSLLLAATFILAAAAQAATETYVVDKAHSEATFQVRHLVTNVSGKFNDFTGSIVLDRAKPAASSVEFTIKAASVDTGNADRDKHLRTEDFFNVEKTPDITFKSTSIKASDKKDVYNVTGNLTIRGVTKQVTLPVTVLGFMKDPWGNDKVGFSTETTINRKDYGVNWNKALDNGGVLLGEDVKITVNIEAGKAKS